MDYDAYVSALERVKKETPEGIAYWMARDLMPILAYATWDKFEDVVQRAIEAATSARVKADHHFSRTGNMVRIGSGAQRSVGDWYLSRYACYLIAMNSDPSKPEVGFAMTYFAEQTRRQEVLEQQLAAAGKRVEIRLRVMANNRRLAGAAKKAGVIRYPAFQAAGHQGLYARNLSEVKALKGLSPADEILDHVGPLELSAHEFKANLTEQRLNRDHVKTEQRAIETHRSVGSEVRQLMVKDHGVRPEDLPTEPSIKRLVQKQQRIKKNDAK
jgi:DNA-damage-inducible protein D